MSRIAPNLSKDQFDVSPLGNEIPQTNRQHIRVPLSARGVRFGTLALAKPHNNLMQTSYATGAVSAYPEQTDARIDPPFVREEPWTRSALRDPIGHLPDTSGCSKTFNPSHAHILGNFFGDQYSYNFAKFVGFNTRFDINRSKSEWESGTALRTYYPWSWNSSPFQPLADPTLSSLVIRYGYRDPTSGNDLSSSVNQAQSRAVKVFRDEVLGVSTISDTFPSQWTFGPKWTSLIADATPFFIQDGASDGMAGVVLGYGARYWIRTQRDVYGSMENTLETRTYQLLTDRDAENSYIRRRWIWVDSQSGVKDRRMMTRRKRVRISTFIIQTWRRQWIDNGAGGAQAIPAGVPATVHRTGVVFGGDKISWLPFVPWVVGEYPGHPTFSFPAFELAVDENNNAAIVALASTFPGVASEIPAQTQYRWHEMRFRPSAPTWSGARKRIIGQSHRTDSKDSATKPSGHPKWTAFIGYGDEYALPLNSGSVVSGNWYAENPGPGDFPILHRPSAAEDHEISYPIDPFSSITQRDLNQQAIVGDGVRLSTAIPDDNQIQDATYHPLADVPAIQTTETFDRLRKQIVTQTASPALTIAAIVTDPKWAWNNNQTRIGTASNAYWSVSATSQLSQGYYGPVGYASDTQLKKAPAIYQGTYDNLASRWRLVSDNSVEQEPSWGYSPGFPPVEPFVFRPGTNNGYAQYRRWSGRIPGEPDSNFSFFTQALYDQIVPRIENMFNWSNAKNVEGWNPRIKPTVTPNPAIVNFIQGQTAYQELLFTPSVAIQTVVLASRVQSETLSVRSIEIGRLNQPKVGVSIQIPFNSLLGSYTFDLRVFDGYNYSDPIPVTVNVLPPPPP